MCVEPVESTDDEGEIGSLPRPLVVRPVCGELPAEGVTVDRRDEGQIDVRWVNGVQAGEHRHEHTPELAPLVGAEVVEEAAAERVRHHVRQRLPLDPRHDDERRAEHPFVRLLDEDLRHGYVRVLADDAHDPRLLGEVVLGEHRKIVHRRAQPGDQWL